MKTVQMLQTDLTAKLAALGWLLRKVGPYLAIEILMPGGTLIALALFLYRRRNAAPDGTTLALRALAARALDQVREWGTRLPAALRLSAASQAARPYARLPMRDRLLTVRALARVRASV